MRKRHYYLFLLYALILSICVSCSSRERDAKNLILETQAIIQSGNFIALEQHLDRILTEYPETKAAATAQKMQEKMLSMVNGLAKTTLKQAIVTGVACQVSFPDSNIDMEKLYDFGFVNTKDVIVEVERPQASNFLLSALHEAGDMVFYGGGDGRIWSEELEEESE